MYGDCADADGEFGVDVRVEDCEDGVLDVIGACVTRGHFPAFDALHGLRGAFVSYAYCLSLFVMAPRKYQPIDAAAASSMSSSRLMLRLRRRRRSRRVMQLLLATALPPFPRWARLSSAKPRHPLARLRPGFPSLMRRLLGIHPNPLPSPYPHLVSLAGLLPRAILMPRLA